MTWSIAADMDIYVYEPDGNRVYFLRKSGMGTLDRDDYAGTGPEHYFLKCDRITAGTY
jgi:uncharacterized protein YfaP (DUF2135 family)